MTPGPAKINPEQWTHILSLCLRLIYTFQFHPDGPAMGPVRRI
jgi:hypothetical protein